MRDLAWLHSGFPFGWGGVVVGGWTQEDPHRVPQFAPYPGFLGANPHLASYDSIRFELGGAAARDGFESGLVRAISVPRISAEPTTRAVLHLGGGSFGYDSNALSVERGDTLRLLRAEAMAVRNLETGVLDRSGHHHWQASGRWITRPVRLDWGFGHRGTARYVIGGEESSGGGESGFLHLTRRVGPLGMRARFERGYDRREGVGGFFLEFSRRDAQATRGGLDATMQYGRATLEARTTVGWEEAHRQGEEAFEGRTRWGWGSLAATMPFGDGTAELAAGAGRHAALGGFDPSFSAFYRIERGGIAWRAGAERALRAMWTDLAAGESPFLQSTWAASLSAERRGGPLGWRGWAHAGRVEDRALAGNHPIEDIWLRDGIVRDLDPYDFALVGADARWRRGRWGASLEGFVAARGDRSDWPRYDPGSGARAEFEYGRAWFSGDLQVAVRGGCSWVGERESFVFESRTLPGYLVSHAGVTLAIGLVSLRIEGRNFENRLREQPWFDTSTGTEALSTARELRFMLTARFFN